MQFHFFWNINLKGWSFTGVFELSFEENERQLSVFERSMEF
jgi:hypothetical protein